MEQNTTYNTNERWGVIVNPVAGNGHGLRDYPTICKYFRDNKILFDAVFTEKKYHAVELAVEFINNGYKKLIVVGGDGTLNETVNGIFLQKKIKPSAITVAVIAVGTGNDWIRMFGVPKKYNEAIKAIVEGRTFLQDVCRINYYEAKVNQVRYMVNVAGVGFDAFVNKHYNILKEKGFKAKMLYIFAMIYSLFCYKSHEMTIEIDNVEVFNGKLLTGALGIGRYNGRGMQQTPLAIADDGLLDVTLIKKMNNFKVLKYMRELFNGSIYSVPGSHFYRGEKVYIKTSINSPIEIDGEACGYSPFELEIIHKALNVIII